MSSEPTTMATRPPLSARAMGAVALGVTLVVTSLMSLLLRGSVDLDMLLTGTTCVVVISPLSTSIVRRYARALRAANRTLESRVAARTADLQAAYTELERETAERRALEQRLLLHDRMATAGSLAAGIAHEIKNPLTGITVNLALIQQELVDATDSGDPAEVDVLADCVRDALDASKQVEVIVRDLNHLAQPVEERLEPTDAVEALRASVRLASHELRHRCTVRTALSDLPPVRGSHARLVQVFLNLLINAARATDAERPNTLTVSAAPCDDGAHIAIADTGVGMSPEVRARLFEPFFTTRRGRGGTGLGMSICRDIVESCGGHIAVESAPGAGTTVTVWLPAAAERSESAA